MLELYHNDMSVCAQKVRIVLAEKELKWKDNHLNLFKGEARTKEYKNLNPNGVVPTLITENRTVIIESTVITEYLDEAFSSPPLKPTTPYSKAAMRLWTKRLDETIHASTASVSNAIAFRHAHIEGKSEEEIKMHYDAIPDPIRRERLWDLAVNGINSIYFSTAIFQFEKLFIDMEITLSENKWLAGNSFSLADIAFTPYITRFDHLNLLGLLNHRPNLLDWYNQVRKRDSYKLAIKDRLEDNIISLMAEKGKNILPKVRQIINKGQ
jgi:glutathione S-transferase